MFGGRLSPFINPIISAYNNNKTVDRYYGNIVTTVLLRRTFGSIKSNPPSIFFTLFFSLSDVWVGKNKKKKPLWKRVITRVEWTVWFNGLPSRHRRFLWLFFWVFLLSVRQRRRVRVVGEYEVRFAHKSRVFWPAKAARYLVFFLGNRFRFRARHSHVERSSNRAVACRLHYQEGRQLETITTFFKSQK